DPCPDRGRSARYRVPASNRAHWSDAELGARLDEPTDTPLDAGGDLPDIRTAGGGRCRSAVASGIRHCPATRDGIKMTGRTGLALAVAGVVLSGGRANATGRDAIPVDGCTIAVPPTRATVEARMAYAGDFCELLSRALGGEVFHSAVFVSPTTVWHYTGA